MNQTLAVAARELRERWLLFPAGLVVGLLPLLLPAFGLNAARIPKIGMLLAVLFGVTAAAIVGGSMLARDTTDGRMAFLFSRPVPWLTIWGGKWLAAVTLVFGGAALAALPWSILYRSPAHDTWVGDLQLSSLLVLVLILGVGFANFNATAFRSRSTWLALDLGLLLLALWLVWRWVAPLYILHIVGPRLRAEWGFLVFLGVPTLALAVATAPQLAIGRTDLRRAHRAMSVTFWCVIFATLGTAGLRLAWARAATPADFVVHMFGSPDPSARWLYVAGESRRGGWVGFLIDAERDRFVPLGLISPFELSMGMVFSRDGHSGAVLQRFAEHSGLRRVDLEGDGPRFSNVELESSPPPRHTTKFALSASGGTALVAHDHGISLFTVASGGRIATATVPPGWRPAATRFLEEQRARVWLLPVLGPPHGSNPPAEVRIVELGVGREPQTTAAPLETVVDQVRSWPQLVHPDAGGERILTRDGALHLRDGATGALMATLVEGSAPASAVFLADGRIAVGEAVGARTSLHVFAPDGVSVRDVVLDKVASFLVVGPEVAPGMVAVLFGGLLGSPETLVVDVDDGRVVETLPAVQRLRDFWMQDTPGAGISTLHFLVEDGTIVRRDFATGERRVVAGPGASLGERISLD